MDELKLFRIDYFSSEGKEIFLSFETKDNSILFGFLRLRIMSNPQRNELNDGETINSTTKKILSAVVRELHVYGPLVKIELNSIKNNNQKEKDIKIGNNSKKNGFIYQHKGIGQKLLKEAERISKQEYSLKKLSVISAIGTREYYKKFGYVINGPYVTKTL